MLGGVSLYIITYHNSFGVNVDYKNIEDSNYDLPAGAVLAPILGERLVGARGLGRRNGHWKKNLVGHMHKHAIFHIKPTYNH